MGKPLNRDQIRAKLRLVDTRRAAGVTILEACRAAGISPSTYRRWKKCVRPRGAEKLRDEGAPRKPQGASHRVPEAAPRIHITTSPRRKKASRVQSMFKWAGQVVRAISFTESLNQTLQDQIARTIELVVAQLPHTSEYEGEDPEIRCEVIIQSAAARAAASAGSFALPLGPLAIFLILPDLMLIWKIQAQMVADIGGVFGKRQKLTPEQMVFCLFKHATGHTMRSVAVRTGKRVLVGVGSGHVLRRLIARLSLPVIGAVAGGVFAYRDTVQIGKTAVESFQSPKRRLASKAATGSRG
ncbi:transposase [Verrucomicrobiota bacterium sgz303538]